VWAGLVLIGDGEAVRWQAEAAPPAASRLRPAVTAGLVIAALAALAMLAVVFFRRR
jgi:hypothetical protein